jgi:hypothetical protein
VSNGQINRELQVLKRIFSLAIDSGRIASKPKFKMLTEAPPRAGFFEREQYESVLRHLPAEIRPVELSGHLTSSVFRRYDIVSESDLLHAAAALDAASVTTKRASR